MSGGCFSNSAYDKWLEDQANEYYDEDEEMEPEEDDGDDDDDDTHDKMMAGFYAPDV